MLSRIKPYVVTRDAIIYPTAPAIRPQVGKHLTPTTGCINHVGLSVLSVPHAERAFYAPLLTYLGFRNTKPYVKPPSSSSSSSSSRGSRGGRSVWSHFRHKFGIILYDALRGGAGSRGGAVGLQHLCLNAGSRGEVDEIARMCKRRGIDVDGPEAEEASPGYYACHLYDIDGIHVEIATTPGLWDDPDAPKREVAADILLGRPLAEQDRASPHPPPLHPSDSNDTGKDSATLPPIVYDSEGWSSPRPASPATAQRYRQILDKSLGQKSSSAPQARATARPPEHPRSGRLPPIGPASFTSGVIC